MVEGQLQSLRFANRQVGNLDPGGLGSSGVSRLPVSDIGLWAPKSGVTGLRSNKSVQIVWLDDVEVHHGYMSESRRGQTGDDIKPYAASPHDQDSASGEIGLAFLAPCAYSGVPAERLGTSVGKGQGSTRRPCGRRSPLRFVEWVESTRRPTPVSQWRADHVELAVARVIPTRGSPCRRTDEIGVTGFGITVRPAHLLPSASPGVAVQYDQSSFFLLGFCYTAQYVLGLDGDIPVDASVAVFGRYCLSDQCAEARPTRRGAIYRQAEVFLAVGSIQ